MHNMDKAKTAISDALEAAEEAVNQLRIAHSSGSPTTIIEALKDAKTAFATSKRAVAYAFDAMPESVSERERQDTAEKQGQLRIAGTGDAAPALERPVVEPDPRDDDAPPTPAEEHYCIRVNGKRVGCCVGEEASNAAVEANPGAMVLKEPRADCPKCGPADAPDWYDQQEPAD